MVMTRFAYYIMGVIAIASVSIFTPISMGDVTGGPQHLEGELSPNTSTAYKFDFEKGKEASIRVSFAPKTLRERSEQECQKFSIKLWVGNEWFMTVGGRYIYVEDSSGKETLRCVAAAGYGSGHQMARKNQTLTISLINDNIWKAIYVLDTN
jgi:hypothetical protein